MAHVSRLSVSPVKGLALVSAEEVYVGRHGVAENRLFYLVDETGRRYGALRDGRILAVAQEYDAERERLTLRFPDGAIVDGVIALGEELVTDFYRRPVRGRVVKGPWAGALSEFVGRPLALVRAERPGAGVDRARGPVSLTSEASLAELGRRAGLDTRVDGRRFRMLVTVDGCAAHEEDDWCGRRVAIGDAVVRILEPVARCAITTKNPDTGDVDFETLRQIIGYRGVRDGKHADFGVFGDVVKPGRVRVGDAVEPL